MQALCNGGQKIGAVVRKVSDLLKELNILNNNNNKKTNFGDDQFYI